MIASSWMDPVLGVDMHWELVPVPPGAPVPMPFPHPYIGIVVDLGGLAGSMLMGAAMSAVFGAPFAGPVLHWLPPATNTGTESKHIPGHFIIPPGTLWAPVPRTPKPKIHPGEKSVPAPPIKPENDAVCITGSKTVHIGGSNGVRLGDMLLSCSEPVRLPSSVVLAIPKGAPILVGGPPALDLLAAVLASLRTRFVSDSLHALVSRLAPGRLRNLLNRAVCFFTGHPVDVASGKVMTSSVEVELPGPLPLKIERVYSSAFADRDGPLGHGWSLSLDQAIWTERGRVVLLEEDGRELEFDAFDLPEHRMRPGDRLWHPIDRLELECLEEGRWRVTSVGGVVREFGPVAGRPDGRAMIERTRSPCGHHEIAYEYDEHGALEWVRDACGRLIWLERDTAGRVRALKLPLPSGQGWYVHRRYGYDERGDLVQVTDALEHAWRFEYTTHLLVRETDRTGLSFYFQYDGLGPDAWCTRTWGDGGIYDHELAYDKVKKVTFVTDSLGRTTQYHMNLAGLVVKVVDPLGGETRYECDPRTLQRTEVIDALGNSVRFQYDARGNTIRTVGPDGAMLQAEYDRQDRIVAAVGPGGNFWECRYDAAGRPIELVDPMGGRTRYAYDGKGLLQAVTAPGGLRTAFEYDAQKNVARAVGSGGWATEYAHDALGRLVRVKDARGAVTRLGYDALGRLVRERSPSGEVRHRSYDAEGNPIAVHDATRRLTLRYGHFHKLIEREEAGATLRLSYDTEGRVTRFVNEAGEVCTLERDERGEVNQEIGFDGAVRRYTRDKLGRVVLATLPSGRTRAFAYDRAGRVRSIDYSDGGKTTLEYRADGLLSRATNEAAAIVFERDPLGRIVREVQGDVSVSSRFGPDGERTLMETSLGGRMVVLRDEAGDVAAIHCGDGAQPSGVPVVQFERDALGLELARVLPGGVRVEWQWDPAGRPTARRIVRESQGGAAIQQDLRQYEWHGDTRISAILDAARGATQYLHDPRGRLVGETRSDATVHRAMDAVGNVYRTPTLSDRRYAPGGRLESDGAARFVHDADGNQTERIDPDGGRWRYRWNDAGMLAEVGRPDGLLVRFGYDALARRVRKALIRVAEDGTERLEQETRFIWDGHALAHEVEDRGGGRPVVTSWYFEPNSFTPVAKTRDGARWSIATDHLGSPTELYDEAGELAWKMQLDVYGVGKPDVVVETCPWRWPGQYADDETGLHYNRWRYYDPAGRFISPDPIGLRGGAHSTAYPVDPLLLMDPMGLMPMSIPTFQGHHIIPHSAASALGIKPFNSQYGVPSYYFIDPPASAHDMMHGYNMGLSAVERPPVTAHQLQQQGLTPADWLQRLRDHYSRPELQGLRGDLRLVTENGPGRVIAQNVTPLEAFERALEWGREHRESADGACY